MSCRLSCHPTRAACQTVVQLVLWPGMQQEVHLRSIRPKNVFNPVVGQTVSVIDAPESTPELCTASWSLALLRTMDSPLVPASSNYLQNSSLPAYVVDAQLTLTDESPYRVTRQLWEWDHVNFRFGAMVSPPRRASSKSSFPRACVATHAANKLMA
eukprot:4625864-Pleurochrysis_carterae.AAC.2